MFTIPNSQLSYLSTDTFIRKLRHITIYNYWKRKPSAYKVWQQQGGLVFCDLAPNRKCAGYQSARASCYTCYFETWYTQLPRTSVRSFTMHTSLTFFLHIPSRPMATRLFGCETIDLAALQYLPTRKIHPLFTMFIATSLWSESFHTRFHMTVFKRHGKTAHVIDYVRHDTQHHHHDLHTTTHCLVLCVLHSYVAGQKTPPQNHHGHPTASVHSV